MFHKKFLLVVILLFIISFSPLINSVKPEDLCSYDGPDVSEDYLELTNFIVEGPDEPDVGDSLRVRFTLRNVGNNPIDFTDKGVFAAVRTSFYNIKDFGFTFQEQTLDPYEVVNFDANITVDVRAYWQIWPSYEYMKPVWSPVLKKYVYFRTLGPNHWHECQLTICPDYCKDGTHYYNGHADQEGNCSYLTEECEYGCNENETDCSNVSRIKIIDGPSVDIDDFYCWPRAHIYWMLNIAGTGIVYYREFGSLEWLNTSSYTWDSTTHGHYIYYLKPDTTYYYYVKSCGPDDCVESTWDEFTTTNMLHVEDVSVSELTSRTATISWKTHCYSSGESAFSGNRVLTNYTVYVVPTMYSHLPYPPWSSVRNETLDFEHSVTLRGMLDEDKNYTFFIQACREDGICVNSSLYTFETKEQEFPQIFGMNIEPTHHSVDISWSTYLYLNTTIFLYDYASYTGPESWLQKKGDSNFVSDHSFYFEGLSEGTRYFFIIKHCIPAKCNSTGEYFFTTTSCYDGILNGGEYNVDCGGPCDTPCAEIRYECTWCHENITPVHLQGSPANKIDVVFIASKTSRDRVNKRNVISTEYTGNKTKFVKVVKDLVQNWFLKLDTLVSEPIPSDFKSRFNFYYYWDTTNFGDAFDGCSGKLPKNFWDIAPFCDVAGILYPVYWVNGTAEGGGCANGLGPRSQFKGPGFNGYVTIHECGHAIFGLVDEYCGTTHYSQNDPYSNVWKSLRRCQDYVTGEGWDPGDCRQIMWDNVSTPEVECTKNYWRWNPDPEIMECACGLFGPASVRRINYMFNNIAAWRR